MPRPPATSYRFGDDVINQIRETADALSAERNTDVSQADVIREAVGVLHRQVTARAKKLQKKSLLGIDTDNTKA